MVNKVTDLLNIGIELHRLSYRLVYLVEHKLVHKLHCRTWSSWRCSHTMYLDMLLVIRNDPVIFFNIL